MVPSEEALIQLWEKTRLHKRELKKDTSPERWYEDISNRFRIYDNNSDKIPYIDLEFTKIEKSWANSNTHIRAKKIDAEKEIKRMELITQTYGRTIGNITISIILYNNTVSISIGKVMEYSNSTIRIWDIIREYDDAISKNITSKKYSLNPYPIKNGYKETNVTFSNNRLIFEDSAYIDISALKIPGFGNTPDSELDVYEKNVADGKTYYKYTHPTDPDIHQWIEKERFRDMLKGKKFLDSIIAVDNNTYDYFSVNTLEELIANSSIYQYMNIVMVKSENQLYQYGYFGGKYTWSPKIAISSDFRPVYKVHMDLIVPSFRKGNDVFEERFHLKTSDAVYETIEEAKADIAKLSFVSCKNTVNGLYVSYIPQDINIFDHFIESLSKTRNYFHINILQKDFPWINNIPGRKKLVVELYGYPDNRYVPTNENLVLLSYNLLNFYKNGKLSRYNLAGIVPLKSKYQLYHILRRFKEYNIGENNYPTNPTLVVPEDCKAKNIIKFKDDDKYLFLPKAMKDVHILYEETYTMDIELLTLEFSSTEFKTDKDYMDGKDSLYKHFVEVELPSTDFDMKYENIGFSHKDITFVGEASLIKNRLVLSGRFSYFTPINQPVTFTFIAYKDYKTILPRKAIKLKYVLNIMKK